MDPLASHPRLVLKLLDLTKGLSSSDVNRQQGLSLLTAIIFGFLFLSWMLAFITLNASLVVVRAAKDLRVNPYLRASTVLSSRAFALGLATETASQELRSRCLALSGNVYSCIRDGSSQGTFSAFLPLSRFACNGGADTLLGSLERNITSCIRNFSLTWDSVSGLGSLAVETATGRDRQYLYQQSTLGLKRWNPLTPTLLVALPLSSQSCPVGQQTIIGTPQTTVQGNVAVACGSSSVICSPLNSPSNLWVDPKIQLAGCLGNRSLNTNLLFGSGMSSGAPWRFSITGGDNNNELCRALTANIQSDGYGLGGCRGSCPGAITCLNASSKRAVRVSASSLVDTSFNVTEGSAIVFDCFTHGTLKDFSTAYTSGNPAQGAILYMRLQVSDSGNASLCSTTPALQEFQDINGAVSIISPGSPVRIKGPKNTLTGFLLAGNLDLNGSSLLSQDLSSVNSGAYKSLNYLFPDLLRRIAIEDIRATSLVGYP